ncbi:class I SAM-dependent methyltransferase [Caloranaerobacter ferrireducens]|uniref:class I SAM-dependent methyltransferase n=1 Tax=Caloranaerobacter ferrireducens TaxID=1323370 RepID=UPI00084D4293|nr:class I SAM-dependent methyltransferase [Caloranaerobacter ferrireducens]
MNGWEKAYQKKHSGEIKPHPDLVNAEKLFKKNKVKKVLDLGCGDGRHLVFLSRKDYKVYGLDYSKTALERSKKWLTNCGLEAEELIEADFTDLSWNDCFFDAVISTQVLGHGRIEKIKRAFYEIYRVLKSGGYLFITVPKYPPLKNWKDGKYKEIENKTYVPLEGHEEGIVHYFFEERDLRDILSGYDILDFKKDEATYKHYSVLARKR